MLGGSASIIECDVSVSKCGIRVIDPNGDGAFSNMLASDNLSMADLIIELLSASLEKAYIFNDSFENGKGH